MDRHFPHPCGDGLGFLGRHGFRFHAAHGCPVPGLRQLGRYRCGYRAYGQCVNQSLATDLGIIACEALLKLCWQACQALRHSNGGIRQPEVQ
ncbi:hypothetical protein D9M69_626800 [compost metagenome]